MPNLRSMTLRQVALFGMVADAGTVPSYNELAKRLGATKPVITRAFHALTQFGLIVVSRDPNDRRRRLLSLTALGVETRELMRVMSA